MTMFRIIIQNEQRKYDLLTCFTSINTVFLKINTVTIFISIVFLSSKIIT